MSAAKRSIKAQNRIMSAMGRRAKRTYSITFDGRMAAASGAKRSFGETLTSAKCCHERTWSSLHHRVKVTDAPPNSVAVQYSIDEVGAKGELLPINSIAAQSQSD
jgi:hypothetical protein